MTEQAAKTDPLSAYGAVAGLPVSSAVKAGRYGFQRDAEARIPGDVLGKLAVEPHHRVLDIGCGAGLLLFPLAEHAAQVNGLDHPAVIAALAERGLPPNVRLHAGSFPNNAPEGPFDRIVAYSVMHYAADFPAALAFAEAAAGLLAPGGRLLLADLPNTDRQRRFRASAAGQAFEVEWRSLTQAYAPTAEERAAAGILSETSQIGSFNDSQLLALSAALRVAGFDTWHLPQDPALPFGRTREDILVIRP